MGIELSVEFRGSVQEAGSPDVVVFPVAEHKGSVRVPSGLPTEVAELAIPTELDADFCARHRFTAKRGQTLVVLQAPGRPTLLAVGIGDPTANDTEAWRLAAAAVIRAAKGERALLLLPLPSTIHEDDLGEAVVTGSMLASYRYDVKTDAPKPALRQLEVVAVAKGGVAAQAAEALVRGADRGRAIADAVGMARDLVNRVPSEMTPKRLAASALRRLEKADRIIAEVWREQRIEEEKLGALLGVARGSAEAPRVVIATYLPEGYIEASENDEPSEGETTEASPTHVVLVGKGITFDSGGLSLKTATGMMTMKTDMTGAAVVLSAMTALAALGVTAKVTAIAPMSENMPGSAAMKPGDVLTARNGTTIEVLNTDAEGRLILADALGLATEREPDVIIDIATLTGAAVVALGSSMAALMSNDDAAADGVLTAAGRSGEPMWRLPLVDDYASQLESEVADLKNIGSPGEAGSITAGLFLRRFVDGRAWVHLDIAGPARSEKASGYVSKGGTAFGLRTILEYLRALD